MFVPHELIRKWNRSLLFLLVRSEKLPVSHTHTHRKIQQLHLSMNATGTDSLCHSLSAVELILLMAISSWTDQSHCLMRCNPLRQFPPVTHRNWKHTHTHSHIEAKHTHTYYTSKNSTVHTRTKSHILIILKLCNWTNKETSSCQIHFHSSNSAFPQLSRSCLVKFKD